ncbi:phage/plasmid replication domain-containing protein [Chryseobacterium wangxinyae]|uniref:phage/plasmid replication domain-containing protein n=1 Tax=Chryseobacterium sp. CY353 TaxID=2997334 RepID=UPI00226F6031|nr:phage/plasmid replication protein [Chryseobacterium sp. CY353]MCY0971043.1 hypothetical protein [Chryseobacterium sp. CY353]
MSISIDTIHILLPKQEFSTLSNRKGVIDMGTGELKYSEGYYECIKVRQFGDFIKIECSLPKLLKGENIFFLSYREILEALSIISRELNINIKNGTISRIDLFMDISTEYSAKKYFRYLGDSKHYKMRFIVAETSLYYKNIKSREINFYDKIKELNNRKQYVPNEFLNKNITRVEVRYKTFLKNILSRNLNVIDLYNPENFLKLIDCFINDYKSIHKENKAILDFSKASSKKELLNQLAIAGIESLGGTQAVLEMIDASRTLTLDSVRPEYFSRRKAEIKEIANSPYFVQKVQLIEELNKKVETACHNTIHYVTNNKSIV